MTERPSSVRPLRVGDEDKLFDLLCMAYRENAPYRISDDRVRRVISAAVDPAGGTIVAVIESADGELAGSIGATFCQWWYTEEWHIEECWNFVHPDHRRSTHAKNLISYLKWVSEQMKMPLHLGILTSTRMEEKIRLYQRQMPQVGAAFAHNMASAHGPIAGDFNHG